jgi:hypothetical protein
MHSPLIDATVAVRETVISRSHDTTNQREAQYPIAKIHRTRLLLPGTVKVELVSVIWQAYAQLPAGDALADHLADWLTLDADELEHTVLVELVVASVPDRQAPGQVCHDCL